MAKEKKTATINAKTESFSPIANGSINPEITKKPWLTFRRVICYIVLIFFCILCLFFFYMLVINATRAHYDIQKGFSFLPGSSLVTNFQNVLAETSTPIFKGMLNSIIISGCVALLSVYFSAMTAYAIHVYDFKGKKFAFNFIILIMTIPTQVSALGFIQLITKMGMKDTFWPLIIPAVAAPAVFFFMKQYMSSSLPIDIVEAARIDGSNEFKTFNTIVLPMLKPALAVQAIFTFVGAWNNYFTPNLIIDSVGKKTLPILIAQLRSADFLKFDMGQVYMMIAIAIIPLMVVYFVLSKFIIAGVSIGGVKE